MVWKLCWVSEIGTWTDYKLGGSLVSYLVGGKFFAQLVTIKVLL